MNVILLQAVSTLAKTWMLSSLEETELRIAEDIAKENYILQIQKLDGRWFSIPAEECRQELPVTFTGRSFHLMRFSQGWLHSERS